MVNYVGVLKSRVPIEPVLLICEMRCSLNRFHMCNLAIYCHLALEQADLSILISVQKISRTVSMSLSLCSSSLSLINSISVNSSSSNVSLALL